MPSLQGKIAIVTGGGRNIGRSIAVRLAQEGARVAVNCGPGTEDEARSLLDEADRGEIWLVPGDLADTDTPKNLFQQVEDKWGPPHILVNNAAITGQRGPFATTTIENFDRVFAINVRAVLLTMREAAVRIADNGRIINISSATSIYPQPDLPVYGASKAAVKALTEALAQEIGSRGVTVNTVMPGAVSPGLFDAAPPSKIAMVIESSPLKRIGHPDDIAGVVAFLASDDARWITGQHILANGGAKS